MEDNIREEMDSGIDVFSPHLTRSSDWATETQLRTERIRGFLASIGQSVPVYLQEEHRTDWNSVHPTKADFITAVRGARDGGAAGWVFHTDAGFDLASASLYDSFDSVEVDTIDELADAVFGSDEPPSSACEVQYGGVSGVQFCSSTASSCTFRALLNGTMSCSDVCSANGGSCITQYGNGSACEQRGEESCDDVGSVDDICVCTLDGVPSQSQSPTRP